MWTLLLVSSMPSGAQAQGGPEFEKRRAELLEEFDKNGDGRLGAEERAAVREKNRKEALEGKRGRGRRRPSEPHPKELLAKYDKDKSGWIDGKEWDVAGPTESGIIKKQFDANKNGELEDDEKEALLAAIKSEKIKGLYAGIAHYWLIRGAGNGEESYVRRQRRLLEFDANGDGIASREELAAIRAARAAEDR